MSAFTQPQSIQQDIAHLIAIFKLQGQLYSQRNEGATQEAIFELRWPEYDPGAHPYAQMHAQARAQHDDLDYFAIRLFLALALAPSVQPQALDPLAAGDEKGRPFTEYGAIHNPGGLAFLPSFQTGLFILAGNDLDLRFRFQKLLDADGFLRKENILEVPMEQTDPDPSKQRLQLTQGFLHLIMYNAPYTPAFSNTFPAKRLSNALSWEDLVVAPGTMAQIQTIRHWLQHHEEMETEPVIGKRIKPGFRALFYGPSGTGKTLTASLLGKEFGMPVYRVDLSQVVSKYIGETEKNLFRLFEEASGKGWVLFFDEADSLFGKRTQTQSAHDKYANQEVSFLLQRVEDHAGLVILATNFRSNLDEAFLRRFQSVIHFGLPSFKERILLWKQALPLRYALSKDVDIETIARKYELTGAHIVNIIQAAVLDMLSQKELIISLEILKKAIHQEFHKEERHFPD